MAFSFRKIDYFRATVKDEPGEGSALLSALASAGVNLIAFNAVPLGAMNTELTLFPDSPSALTNAAAAIRIHLDGPHRALLVQGDDKLGAFAEVHRIIAQAGLNVIASSGLADSHGTFGYIIHLRQAEIDVAAQVLAGAFTRSGV